ncbi:MAG TPA: DUF4870 domain-containing protein [Trichocoleus sp.]
MTSTATPEARMWATVTHISALSGLIIPFGTILGPLVIWLVKKEEFPLVNEQGKEALNFQISMAIYCLVAAVLIFVLVGIPLLIVLAVLDLVFTIIAALKVNEGVDYRYPMTIRMIK